MVTHVSRGEPAPGSGPGTPRVGARVWLLRDGCFGRICAVAQGGLVCRVRLEDGCTLLLRPGCDLLAVAEPLPCG